MIKGITKFLAIVLFFAIGVTGLYLEKAEVSKTYNNGTHASCGGNWNLISISGNPNCKVYCYQCNKCGVTFSTEIKMK